MVDRRVLEAGVLPARGGVRVLAPERPAPQERPRPQDRREGRRVDRAARRAWSGPPKLRAAEADQRAARSHSLPQGAHPGAHTERVTELEASHVTCTYTAWGGIYIARVDVSVPAGGSTWTDGDWPRM